jgi:colanic acid biosynthesis glycosyl transferase WcaI
MRRATIGVVTQRADIREFNVPSKLMNLMAYGIPVVASVRPDSEVARIVNKSGAGWVTDSSNPDEFVEILLEAVDKREERERRGTAGREFARRHFTPEHFCERFERVAGDVERRDLG